MSEIDVNQLISKDESTNLEFKRQISASLSFTQSEKKELAKDIAAMANTLGGQIVVGYDKRTNQISGIPSDIASKASEYFDTIQRIVKDRCYPPVRFTCFLVEYGGKKLIVIDIPQSQFLHQMKDTGAIYLRRQAIVDTAKPHEIAARYVQAERFKLKLPKTRLKKWPFEDRRTYIFGEKSKPFTKFSKSGPFGMVARCVAFLPHFTLVSPPNFGDYWQSCRVTYEFSPGCSIKDFSKFITEVEETWEKLVGFFLLDAYPSYWSISDHKFMMVGCGAENLLKALESSRYGTMAAILQGCFGEHYDRTCFLVVYGQVRPGPCNEGFIAYLGMDTYLSCAPTDWRWLNKVYSPFRNFGSFQGIDNYSIYRIPAVVYYSNHKPIEPKLIGGIERLGPEGRHREYDQFAGVIMQIPDLKKIPYKVEEVCPADNGFWTYTKECPLVYFDYFICSITNPPPLCSDLETNKVKLITVPKVTVMQFPAPGFSIYGITAHSVAVD